jgi:SNF2-related domain
MLTAESNWFKKRFLWRAVIVDEAHRLKNEKSQLAQKLKIVPAFSRVLLTGTPLQNNLREVSSTINTVIYHYLCLLLPILIDSFAYEVLPVSPVVLLLFTAADVAVSVAKCCCCCCSMSWRRVLLLILMFFKSLRMLLL